MNNQILEYPFINVINCVVCGCQTEKCLGNKIYTKCPKCDAWMCNDECWDCEQAEEEAEEKEKEKA